MSGRYICAATGIGPQFPAYWNLSQDTDGVVRLRVRTPRRDPPHPTPPYPMEGQSVSFDMTRQELEAIHRELGEILAAAPAAA